MLDSFKGFFTSIGAAVVALIVAYYLGKTNTKRQAEVDKRMNELEALKHRSSIDDSLRNETDLAARAARAGIVRND